MSVARIAVPDLVSNSYFPAIAAIELGFFAREKLDVAHELIFPNYKAYDPLRDGKIDFVAGPAHAVFRAFPEWEGAKLLAALAQGMYWLLVMRAELAATPGDVNAVKGRTIGGGAAGGSGTETALDRCGTRSRSRRRAHRWRSWRERARRILWSGGGESARGRQA